MPQAILDRAREMVEDLTLLKVRDWKKQHSGQLAVGYLPVYVPRPFLEAMDILPVAIFGGGDRIDIIRGDSFFQSYICHIPRSVIELGLNGSLDPLDAFIFPSTCDVIRNLGGMWQMLFPDRYSAYLDLPHDFDPKVGGRFYIQQLQQIATELEKRGASPLTDKGLKQAIKDENERQSWIVKLNHIRRQEPWRLLASEAYLIIRAGSALTAREHIQMLKRFHSALAKRQAQPVDNVRVVLRGAFCEQPPLPLIRALEKAGCDIVNDDFQLGMSLLNGPIVLSESPLVDLALAFLKQGKPTACRYIDDQTKGDELLQAVRESQADGVVFAAASFCDPALLDQPMLEKAVERAGIPFTSFKFSENTGQFQVIREQAGAFSDSVKLWGANV